MVILFFGYFLVAFKVEISSSYMYQRTTHYTTTAMQLSFTDKLKLLPPISDEQRKIIDLSGDNILVDSVAGSGKTTCVLYIALVIGHAFPHERILLLTYNKKLRHETRERCDRLQIINLEVHTYHSFANMYYQDGCGTDVAMNNILANNTQPIHNFAYNRIIVDESQDMTHLYFQLVSRIILHNKIRPTTEKRVVNMDGPRTIEIPTEPKMIIIGDKHQGIFTFNDADPRFVTRAPELFVFNKLAWRIAKLTTSYRITIPMAEFLNRAVLHQDRLKSIRPSKVKPKLYICNQYSGMAGKIILDASKKYGAQNMFVLAGSTRSKGSPVIKTVNNLSKKGLSIYVASNEDSVDQAASAGKLVVASFHQVKGLERKCVIIMGADESYYTFHGKNAPRNVCPNVFYVAFTRASEELIMIQDEKVGFLPFLNIDELKKTCDIQGEPSKIQVPKLESQTKQFAVADMIRHLSTTIMITAEMYATNVILRQMQYSIKLPEYIDGFNPGQKEFVADINGVVVPAYFQYLTTGRLSILDIVKRHEPKYPIKLPLSDSKSEACIEEITQIAVRYGCIMSKYTYKEKQLPHFHWLSLAQVNQCAHEMIKFISRDSEFEITLPSKIVNGVQINGTADIIDHGPTKQGQKAVLWELKCVSELKLEHLLQLCIYAYLCGDIYDYRLYNITTGEIRGVTWRPELIDLVELIVNAKITDPSLMDDEKFVKTMDEIRKNTNLRLKLPSPQIDGDGTTATIAEELAFG